MAYYQCFKTTDRTVYCSSSKVKNHAAGAQWVSECITAHNLQGNDLLGKPYEEDTQPRSAVLWP